jgi:hypothetical protein
MNFPVSKTGCRRFKPCHCHSSHRPLTERPAAAAEGGVSERDAVMSALE